MRNYEALRVFGLTSLNGLDLEKLDKLWKKRIREVHPDRAGRDSEKRELLEEEAKKVNVAYDVIAKMIEDRPARVGSVNVEDSSTYIIKARDLVSVYMGNTVIGYNATNKEKVEFNRIKLKQKKKIIIQFDCFVNLGSEASNYTLYCNYNSEDIYESNLVIEEEGFMESKMLRILLPDMDKEINCEIKHRTMKLVFKLDMGVQLRLNIERVGKHG